jgi:2-methylcitrate dehydratase PrpD
VDFQFGLPYILAVMAYGITIGPEWQDMDILRDPRILKFTEKVTILDNPEFDKRPSLNIVEVTAGGKIFRQEKTQPTYGRGGERQFTDEQMVGKFKHNASRILTQNKIEEAVVCLLNLENVSSTVQLMQQVTQ